MTARLSSDADANLEIKIYSTGKQNVFKDRATTRPLPYTRQYLARARLRGHAISEHF